MVVDRIVLNQIGLLGLAETDELNGGNSPLMKKLEETMLAIGARLPKVDHSSFPTNHIPLLVDSLSVAFHVQLLNMGCKFAESLAVGDNCSCRVVFYGSVEETYKSQHHGDIFLNNDTSTVTSFSETKSPSMECPPFRKACIVSKP